jgi:hypothetical protein
MQPHGFINRRFIGLKKRFWPATVKDQRLKAADQTNRGIMPD